MFITSGDFSIKAENFDLTKGWNILRIICGAFMFPHIAGKFAGGALAAGTVSFFAKAGFNPPELWVYLAAAAEEFLGSRSYLASARALPLWAPLPFWASPFMLSKSSRGSDGLGTQVDTSIRFSGPSFAWPSPSRRGGRSSLHGIRPASPGSWRAPRYRSPTPFVPCWHVAK